VRSAREAPEDGVALADARIDGMADHGILSTSSAEASTMNSGMTNAHTTLS